MNIAVIGAGMAGLTAARALQERGHSVAVLEKARRPGGRISTRRVTIEDPTHPSLATLAFDDGAQYFTARDPRFEREVEAWQRARVVQVWHGTLAAFDSEGRDPVDDETMRWVGVPGMDDLTRHLARGLDVTCGRTVTSVDPDGSGGAGARRWRLATKDGDAPGPFDAVVLAVPAPDAVPLLVHTPELAAAAAAVTMHPCWSTTVAFDARVPSAFDGAFVSASPLGWIARDRSKPKRGLAETWVLHAAASWSRAHAGDRADTVGPFLLNAFADLIRGPVPRPVHLGTRRWRDAAADVPLTRGALIDRAARIVVCGDWCLGTRIESACMSGLLAAELLSDIGEDERSA